MKTPFRALGARLKALAKPPTDEIKEGIWEELERQYGDASIPVDSGDTKRSLSNRSHSLNRHWVDRSGRAVWGTEARGAVYRPEIVPRVNRDALGEALKRLLSKEWRKSRGQVH
jgi:hypothetical protein